MVMKILKKLIVVAACLSLILAAGCGKKSYKVYTNMPQDSFEITDKNYNLGAEIQGYAATDGAFEEIDTAGYTSRQRTDYSMNSYLNFVVSDNFAADGAEERYGAFIKAVGAELNAIDKAISATVTGSDIYKFNAAKAGATIEITKITYEVLSTAKAVYDLTDGYYNPALYYNIQAYGFGGAATCPQSAEELPKDSDIENYTALAAKFVGITLEEREGAYFVTKPDYTVEVNGETLSLKLDLGGIGKGYAVDRVDELFEEYGYKFGYFNFGSSSMLVKSHIQAGAYNIGFSSPRSPNREPYLMTRLQGEKLSTSGDDEQFYTIDGVRYCHIIDPTTGKPVQTGIMSVTVIGGSAAEDDALTTAIMAMGKTKAIKFIEEKLTDRKVAFTVDYYVA